MSKYTIRQDVLKLNVGSGYVRFELVQSISPELSEEISYTDLRVNTVDYVVVISGFTASDLCDLAAFLVNHAHRMVDGGEVDGGEVDGASKDDQSGETPT